MPLHANRAQNNTVSASAALLIDFGSTYTKVRAVDLAARAIIGSGQGPSTVMSDVGIGLQSALDDLERRVGVLPSFRYRLAASSAAGGLRMVTIGLIRELTATAAREAALGAGAKLVGTFANRLTSSDLRAIVALAPDIVLLAGGTDGGNSEVAIANARALATTPLRCPIIFAGNRAAADDVALALDSKTLVVTENVMPELGVLGIEPAREAIRRVFIERIVHAKGLDRAQAMLDNVAMPTPAAVMEGATLLADGYRGAGGWGPLLVVDPGGATTDVHSVCSGEPSEAGVVMKGLPEPRVKRTVEGDLGMRLNAETIVEAAGVENLAADADLSVERFRDLTAIATDDVGWLPQRAEERSFDRALLRAAVRLAVKRHAGRIETVYTALGPVTVQHGKDLSRVGTVIATGGAPANSEDPQALLEPALADPAEPFSLRPRDAKLFIDRDYVLFACGLLATVEPECALELARNSLESHGPARLQKDPTLA